jgi:hypothetical protein
VIIPATSAVVLAFLSGNRERVTHSDHRLLADSRARGEVADGKYPFGVVYAVIGVGTRRDDGGSPARRSAAPDGSLGAGALPPPDSTMGTSVTMTRSGTVRRSNHFAPSCPRPILLEREGSVGSRRMYMPVGANRYRHTGQHMAYRCSGRRCCCPCCQRIDSGFSIHQWWAGFACRCSAQGWRLHMPNGYCGGRLSTSG